MLDLANFKVSSGIETSPVLEVANSMDFIFTINEL